MDWTTFFILLVIHVIVIFLLVKLYGQPLFTPPKEAWSINIQQETLDNNNWRKVLHTSDNLQIVAMSVPVGEELGWEVHSDNDQLFRVVQGDGLLETRESNKTVKSTALKDGIVAIVPNGNYHNLKNVGSNTLRFYTVYGPPHHKPGTIDVTHADEIAREG
jgi:mannose-6-phosphate isomerase-like protein (cupin superfamily)